MELKRILDKYNIVPNNKTVFFDAITHTTFANETKYPRNYQRLEFLGDALLAKAAALKTFNLYKDIDEGQMTIIRSNAVSGEQLAKFTKEMELDKVIRFGNSSETLVENIKILADVFESFVAAIYLDLGEKEMDKFLVNNVYKFIKEAKGQDLKNPKTILQELLQADSRENVIYKTKEVNEGFEAKVTHNGSVYGTGRGRTKKKAEIKAAENALEKVEFK